MLTDVLKKGRKETLSYNIDARVLVTLITLDVANKLTVGPRCFSIELSRFDSNNEVSYRDLSSGNEVNVAVSSRRWKDVNVSVAKQSEAAIKGLPVLQHELTTRTTFYRAVHSTIRTAIRRKKVREMWGTSWKL